MSRNLDSAVVVSEGCVLSCVRPSVVRVGTEVTFVTGSNPLSATGLQQALVYSERL